MKRVTAYDVAGMVAGALLAYSIRPFIEMSAGMRSESIDQRMERWCGSDVHPKYTENERLVCKAAFMLGAHEGWLAGQGLPNTEFEVDKEGRQVVKVKRDGEEAAK